MTTDAFLPEPTDLNGRVAEEIRVAMLRRRISGRRLAQLLEVSPTWVSYRLTGAQPIGLDDLERIAAALNTQVRMLLPADVSGEVTRREVGANLVSGGVRPPDRRPGGYPSTHIPPSGLTRTARSEPAFAA